MKKTLLIMLGLSFAFGLNLGCAKDDNNRSSIKLDRDRKGGGVGGEGSLLAGGDVTPETTNETDVDNIRDGLFDSSRVKLSALDKGDYKISRISFYMHDMVDFGKAIMDVKIKNSGDVTSDRDETFSRTKNMNSNLDLSIMANTPQFFTIKDDHSIEVKERVLVKAEFEEKPTFRALTSSDSLVNPLEKISMNKDNEEHKVSVGGTEYIMSLHKGPSSNQTVIKIEYKRDTKFLKMILLTFDKQ